MQASRVADGPPASPARLFATLLHTLCCAPTGSQVVEEIRLLASLNHPNIIAYYEAFCDHDKLCVVTEIVQGGDLGTFIRQAAGRGLAFTGIACRRSWKHGACRVEPWSAASRRQSAAGSWQPPGRRAANRLPIRPAGCFCSHLFGAERWQMMRTSCGSARSAADTLKQPQ